MQLFKTNTIQIIIVVFILPIVVLSCSLEKKKVEEKELKILFVGDLMLDRGVKRSVYKNFNSNYSAIFEEVSEYLKSFDIVIPNLEGPVSHGGNKIIKPYSFRFETNIIEALLENNIKIVNLANNHIWDYKIEAYFDTIKYLSNNGIGFFGVGDESNYTKPYIIKLSNRDMNFDIVIIGFTEFSDIDKHSRKSNLVSIIDIEKIEEVIKREKNESNFVIVCFHWGIEYAKTNSKSQRFIATKTIDAGADLIIGHHSHVIQNWEVYKGKFIFYSLGNFVFDQRFSKDTMKSLGVALVFKISSNKIDINIKNTYFYQDYNLKVFLDDLNTNTVESNFFIELSEIST